jgi:ATP-dependent Clp protease adaptor protein ClpS
VKSEELESLPQSVSANDACMRGINAVRPGGCVSAGTPPSLHCNHRRKQTKKKKPPQYRVMLHNDSFNRREYVVKVLLKVVDVITMADAVNIMQVTSSPCAATAGRLLYVVVSPQCLRSGLLIGVIN